MVHRRNRRCPVILLQSVVSKTVVFDTWKVARLDLRTCRRRNRWMCGEGLCNPWRGRAVEPASNEHRTGAIALLQSRNAQMIHHMGHGAPPRLMAPRPIRGPDPRESYATPSAGNRIIRRYGLAEHLARADRALRPPELRDPVERGGQAIRCFPRASKTRLMPSIRSSWTSASSSRAICFSCLWASFDR
jgi:hypothetical protein